MVLLFQQYRSRSGYWKFFNFRLGDHGTYVSTISIQKWILKVCIPGYILWRFPRFQQYRSRSGYWKCWRVPLLCSTCKVSTISIQKWILKVVISWVPPPLTKSFNNIDPEVDTESCRVDIGSQFRIEFQQYRSRSGYWKSISAICSYNSISVSTISIQKWILKAKSGLYFFNSEPCFNNIDPEVDTERWRQRSRWTKNKSFQQYRSRSGYWKTQAKDPGTCPIWVSTISIQKWILKD